MLCSFLFYSRSCWQISYSHVSKGGDGQNEREFFSNSDILFFFFTSAPKKKRRKAKKPALSELNNLNSVFYLPALSGVWFTLGLHV